MKRIFTLYPTSFVKSFFIGIAAFLGFSLFTTSVVAQTKLVSWDMSGVTNYGPSPLAPSITNANLENIVGFTRGAGLAAGTGGVTGGWGATNWADTQANALTDDDMFYFGFKPKAGFAVSVNGIDPFSYRRSSTGPSSGLVQYTIDNGTSYSGISQGVISFGSSSSSGAGVTPVINMSFDADLQGTSQEIGFRVVPFGSTSASGTFYIFDVNSSGDDFSVMGRILGTTETALALAACKNLTGTAQTFTVKGDGLTAANIIVTAPANFEISTDDVTYSSSLTLTPTGGSVNQQYYVRLISGLADGSYTGNISVIGGGFTSAANLGVSLTGTVYELPTAVVNSVSPVCVGDAFPTVSIDLTGSSPWNLTYSDGTNSPNEPAVASSPFTITSTADGEVFTATALTDANGCVALAGDLTGSANIVVNPLPEVSLVATDGSSSGMAGVYNQGETVTITATINVGSGAFSWSGPDGFTAGDQATINVPNATSAKAGTYTVTVTDANTCVGTETIDVVVYDNTIYVATTGDDNNTGSAAFPLATIQKAIDVAVASNTIEVTAGSYPENVNVDKALILKGANFGTDGCDAGRSAEAIIAGDGSNNSSVTVAADGVTIDGFNITGFDGISVTGFENTAISNNLLTVDRIGVSVTGALTSSSNTVTISGNCINLNNQLISDPIAPTTIGIALNGITGTEPLVITNNDISGAFYGYLVYALTTNPVTVISGGTITGIMQGIAAVNTLDASNFFPSMFDVEGVTMSGFTGNHSTAAGANFHAGVYTFTGGGSTTASAITANVRNVDIQGTLKPNQSSAGINVGDFSTGTDIVQNVTVDKSIISNNANRGVNVRGKSIVSVTNSTLENNGSDAFGTDGNDGFTFIAREGAQITATNNFIVHPATSTTPVTAFSSASGANVITANENSILINGNATGKGANGSSGVINATCNWWGGVAAAVGPLMSGNVNFELFLVDGTDNDGSTVGFQPVPGSCKGCSSGLSVENGVGNFFCTIQEAIDDPSTIDGQTLTVADGTYSEDITITKEVKLVSENGKASTTITGVSANMAINVQADNVTIEGFTITNPDNVYGIYSNSNSGLTVKDNHVTDVGDASLVSRPVYGILVEASASAIDDIEISGNEVDDINGGIRGSIGAIAVGFSTGDFDVTNLVIDDNTISDIDANTTDFSVGGRGAYGILLNLGARVDGTGKVVSPVISNNSITDIEGLWATGIGLEGDTPGADVSNNTIANLTDHKGPSNPDASGVKVEQNDGAATVVISNNNFSDIGSGSTLDGFGVNNFTTTLVNANNNYWGATDGPAGEGAGSGVKVTENVSFCPYLNDVVGTGVAQGCPVKNVDTGETFASIQSAIDDSDTDNGDVIEVASGDYDELVLVNKQLKLKGTGASKPKVAFSGTSAGQAAVFQVTADEVEIDNFEIDVDLTKLSSGIVVTGAGIDDIIITNNVINPTVSSNTPSFGSYGNRNAISINYAGNRVATGGVDNVTVSGNIVNALADDGFGSSRLFRSGVSVDEAGGTFTGNDFTSINHDILLRFNSNGPVTIDNNDFRGGGVQIGSHNAGGGQVDITNNRFDSQFANTYTSSLRLQYNNQGKQTNVTGNTFNNHNWGISLENYKSVTIDNNTFTPLANSTTYRHITTNTKVLVTDTPPINQTTIDAAFTNNVFNGSGTAGGTALAFYNHDDANDTYGTFIIGSVGNENTFNTGIDNFILLGNQTGPTTGLDANFGYGSLPSTTAACWPEDLVVSQNNFDVGTGIKLPLDMTLAERQSLEDLIFHKLDDACLATVSYFLPIENVTQSSNHATIQDAIDNATAGDVIRISINDYTEPAQIVVDKNLTLEGTGIANTTLRPGINTGNSGDARGFILVNGGVDLDLKDLTINGTGRLIWQAVRQRGEGTINNVNFTEIKYNPSTNYQGTAVAAFGTGNVDITNCTFSEIGRVGVLYFGTGINVSNFSNNTYTGKGIGDWLDYAVDVSNGAIVNITNNAITNSLGVASSDGSTSAGILVSTFFGPGTTATISGNTISNNSTGVFVGFDASDASTVVVNENDIIGNDNGVFSTAAFVNATNNYWGTADGPGGNGTGTGSGISSGVDACPYYDGLVATGSLVDCPVKVFDNDPTTTGTQVSTHFSIQEAVDATATLDGYFITVAPGTYDEQVVVNKELNISGVGATQPIVNFTGTVAGKTTLFDVSKPNVTIKNIQFDVDLTKLHSAIVVSGTDVDNISIIDNTINATGSSSSSNLGGYGDRNAVSVNYGGSTNYRVATGGVDNILFQGNTVTATLDDGFGQARSFRSGISTDESGGLFTNNTIASINHDILVRFGGNGIIDIINNNFNGGGVQLADMNASAGTITVSGNAFDGSATNTYSNVLRLQNNNNSITTNILNNTFVSTEWAVSLENYNSVTLDGNTFTPVTNSTTYNHVVVNTKSISSNSSTINQVAIGAAFLNNTFNGSGILGGRALLFQNHDSDNASFGTFTLGSSGNENTFNAGIATFIGLDNQVGSTNGSTFPTYPSSGGWITTMACWSEDLDAKFNNFDVGSGAKLPTAMTFAERQTLEDKIFHKPDDACLANVEYFLPVKNITQGTAYSTIGEAITDANAADVIEIAQGVYNERVFIDKSLTLRGADDDEMLYVLDGTGLSGNGDGIQLANGAENVTIKQLTIQNFSGGGGNTDAGIYAIGGNDGLIVDDVAIKNNVGGSGIYANGPIDGVSITNSTIEGQTSGARGIVIWNGFKQNITITGNTLSNNNCCGIELQDGTASAVNVSNNTIDIGIGDNAIGLTSLNELTGPNVIDNNTITGGGRFGIEIKNPAGGVTVSNNSVTLSTQNGDLRDRAGIAVFRRGFIDGQGYANIPNGVTVTGNTVTGYQQTTDSEGFGIVVEGTNHTVTNNTLNNNDVGFQQQAGHTPYTADASGDGNQANIADLYFGRGNSPELCNITASGNSFSGNGVDERIVIGGGTGTIVTEVTPTVDDPTDVEVCDGATIAAITFTGNNLPGVVYNWTNDNTDIGLAASGTGDISSYTAVNSILTPVTATITVTPTVNGCDGTPQEFTITINPSPIVAAIANQTLCVGESVNTISFTGNGTSYDWVNDNDAIGLALSGSGDISSFTATNATGVSQIAYVTVTPTFTSASSTCVGESESFSIIVKDDAPAEIICQSDATLDNDAGLCSAVYNFELPLAFDPQFYDGFENTNWENSSLGWTNFNAVISALADPLNVSNRIGNINTTGDAQTGVFSRLGGYSSTFGNGFRNKVDVYIDLTDPAVTANTYGFDVSAAVNDQTGSHKRDFIFHAASNASGNVLIGGSNNSNFAKRNDLATINNYEITTSGWYTFEWMFQDKGDGTLEVDLNLKDDSGNTLFTETRNDASDVIATEIGGNRYMWFTFITADELKIDNVEKANILTTTSDIASGSAFPVGTTTVTLTAEADACGDQATCTFDVTVNDVEAPTFTVCPTDVTICADDATYSWTHVTLNDLCDLTGGLQELSYTLSGATTSGSAVIVNSYDGSTQGTETFNVGTTTVTYSGKDAAGNVVSNACSFTVTVEPKPSFELDINAPTTATLDATGSYNETACNGSTFTANPANVSSASLGAVWVKVEINDPADMLGFGAGASTLYAPAGSIAFNNVLTHTESTTQTITGTITPYIETDGAATPATASEVGECLGDPLTFTVNVEPTPTATVTGDATVCLDATEPQITFTGSAGTEPYTFTYTIDGGSPLTVTTTSGNTASVNVPTNAFGTFEYELTEVSSGNTCSATVSGQIVTVTVNEGASVDAGTYSAICQAGSIILSGSFSGAATSITWSDGGVGGSFAPNANDPLAVYTPPTGFDGTVTLTITSDDPVGPCPVATATATLVVNPNPVVSIDAVTPFCEGGTLNIVATATGAATYSWNGPDGFTSTDLSPTIENATAAASGTYTLTATSAESCPVTATVEVTVFPLPSAPIITADNNEICKGTNSVLTASCANATDTFRWTVPPINQGNGTSNLSSTGTQIVTTPGTYTGYCESKDGCIGPEGSITITEGTNCGSQNFITVTPELPIICPGASIDLTASGCTGTVSWTSTSGTVTGTTVTLTPPATTTYLVNCSTGGSATVEVRVAQPNVVVTNNISTGKAVTKAVNTIESDKQIGNPNITPAPNVIYEAGNAIMLKPGFTAQGGAVFKAEIKVCN